MGIVPEQKLIIKHTFLEFVGLEDEDAVTSKPLRQRSQTEPAIESDFLFHEVSDASTASCHTASSSSRAHSAADSSRTLPLQQKPLCSAQPTCLLATPEVSPKRPSSGCATPQQCQWLQDSSWQPQCESRSPGLVAPTGFSSSLDRWSNRYSNESWYSYPSQQANWNMNINYFDGVKDVPAFPVAPTPQLPASPSQVPHRMPAMEMPVESIAEETRTTVMLRGLPDMCSRSMLLHLLQTQGFFGRFNFVYLPVDFKRHTSLGYAIVNLISPSEALHFSQHFAGFSNWNVPSSNICSVTWCSPQQGLQAHVERYRNSPVMHESVPEEWRPLLLSNGVPIPFPPPTIKIKAPRLKGIH